MKKLEMNRCSKISNKKEINYLELKRMIKEGAVLLDVRSHQEYAEGHLDGAISYPEYELNKNIENVIKDKNKMIILYCTYGGRAKRACEYLRNIGYKNVYNLKGGLEDI